MARARLSVASQAWLRHSCCLGRRGRDRFVWLLEYDGDDYEAANEAYYDSSERQALDPDPARHLSATEHWPLQSVF